MRLGVFARTFPASDPFSALAAARAAGFEVAQYNMACSGLPAMPDMITPEALTGIVQAATATGVAIAALSGTYNMIHPDPAERAAGIGRLEVIAAAAARIGAPLVTLCTGTRDPDDQWRRHPDNATPEAWRDLLAEMAKAAGIAERHGLRLGIEPELANVVDSARKARRMIDELASPIFVIVIDPANLFEIETHPRQRDIVSAAIDLLADDIVMGHAKDRSASGGFASAGTGVVDFDHYIACLRGAGFDGDLIAHGMTAAEAPRVARFLRGRLGPR